MDYINISTKVLSIIIIYYFIIRIFITGLSDSVKIKKEINTENEKTAEVTVRLIGALIFLLIIIFSIVIVLERNITYIITPLIIWFILFVSIMIIQSIINTIRFIFGKKYIIKISEYDERSIILLSGILIYISSNYYNETISAYLVFLNQQSTLICDILITISILGLLFLFTFFTCAISFFALQRTCKLILRLFPTIHYKYKMINYDDNKAIFQMKRTIKALKGGIQIKYIHIIIFYFIIDFILGILDFILELLKQVFFPLCNIIIMLGSVIICGIIKISNANNGTTIVVASRISIIGAFIILYIYNSYYPVLSQIGTDVFRFVSSVIIIPILITQIIDIRTNVQQNKR